MHSVTANVMCISHLTKRFSTGLAVFVFLFQIFFGSVQAEETFTFKLKEIRVSEEADVLPLPNGDKVFVEHRNLVLTDDKNGVAFSVTCMELGLQESSGNIRGNLFCVNQQNDVDAFAVEGEYEGDSGTLRILGGTGVWEGAHGSGEYVVATDGLMRRIEKVEFSITRP